MCDSEAVSNAYLSVEKNPLMLRSMVDELIPMYCLLPLMISDKRMHEDLLLV